VSAQEGQALADQHVMLFLEASAKTAYNVDLLFEMLSENILEKIEKGVLNPRD
jgi:Ras-related protein Rab-2A